jgi:hypothetical protein
MSAKGDNSKTRTNHNQIEKQYRNRLNSQFEVLLSILPKEEVGSATTVPEGEGKQELSTERVEERKVSKAEVLEMAQKHIRRCKHEVFYLPASRWEYCGRDHETPLALKFIASFPGKTKALTSSSHSGARRERPGQREQILEIEGGRAESNLG